jgi:hypothetical protein
MKIWKEEAVTSIVVISLLGRGLSQVIPRLTTGVAVAKGREQFCLELAPSVCSTKFGKCHSSFEKMEKFKYLGRTLTNQNCIQEEIKSRLKSGNICYHLVQNRLSYSVVSKNLKMEMYGI